jgi:predicted nuclease of predicted toxin-antitoxin system
LAEEAEQLFVSLFLDENVDEKLGPVLRRYGYQAHTAREAGRKGCTDEEQLEYAVQQKMAILSHNIADFVLLHRRWLAQGKHHHGIILTSTTEFRSLLRKVLAFLDRYAADELVDQCRFL